MALKRASLLLLLLLSTLMCLQLNVCSGSNEDHDVVWVVRRHHANTNDWNRFSHRDTGKGRTERSV